MRKYRLSENSKFISKSVKDPGAEILGGIGGTGLGLMTGDPIGVLIGAAAGPIITKTVKEFASRILSRNEKRRTESIFSTAASEIQERIKLGESPRRDKFFQEDIGGRSEAEEIFEGIILKAQREPEEKKIKYLAYLFSNVCFDATISSRLANQILKTAEQLTYRQLCIVKIAGMENKPYMRMESYREREDWNNENVDILAECLDLHNRSIIDFGGIYPLGFYDVIPSAICLQGIGHFLHRILNLSTIPDEDVQDILQNLK